MDEVPHCQPNYTICWICIANIQTQAHIFSPKNPAFPKEASHQSIHSVGVTDCILLCRETHSQLWVPRSLWCRDWHLDASHIEQRPALVMRGIPNMAFLIWGIVDRSVFLKCHITFIYCSCHFFSQRYRIPKRYGKRPPRSLAAITVIYCMVGTSSQLILSPSFYEIACSKGIIYCASPSAD